MDQLELRVRNAVDQHGDWIASQEGIISCGAGLDRTGKPCVLVGCDNVSIGVKAQIEKRVGQVPVLFEEAPHARAY